MRNKKFYPVIGLEVHVELKTKSKMFCGCSADYFGKEPNTYVCPICLGLPGSLPVPNNKAVKWCVMIGLALNCNIPPVSKFDRKNYFYPDLPKGYQISQYDQPFAINGYIKIDSPQHLEGEASRHLQGEPKKRIQIRRVHMEEDTGKLTHSMVDGEKVTLIDFNRSGVPLVEIVTEPNFENARQVVEYLKKLQQIVRYLGVSDADMEKGEMRLEPNISLKPVILASKARGDVGQASMTNALPPYKVEVKNINSFSFVEKAIKYEIKRQEEILNEKRTPIQETRGWDEDKQKTVSQRVKEETQDYRYFPEPDIPPLRFTDSQILNLKSQMPKTREEKEKKIINFGLTPYQAKVSTATVERADFIQDTIKLSQEQHIDTRGTVNFVLNRLINNIGSITPQEAIEEYKKYNVVESVSEDYLNSIIDNVLSENPKAVTDYKAGKENALMFLVGQVMRTSGLKLDANNVKKILKKVLQ